MLSADGTKVAFRSEATNLDPADTDSTFDVYVKNLTTGGITLASTSDTGSKGNARSFAESLSADGTKVAFVSYAANLDPADTDDLIDAYVKDLTTGELTLAATSDSGIRGNSGAKAVELSGDGTRAFVVTTSNNRDPADTDDFADIYMKNLTTGDLTLVSTSDTGGKGNERSTQVSPTADGTKVAFASRSTNFDPADSTDFDPDVYVKNLSTGEITLVSTTDTGAKSVGIWEPSISRDGTRVVFVSYASLDPRDTDTTFDIYVKNLTTGDLTLASTSAFGVDGNSVSFDLPSSLSADGTKLAFYSRATNLDPGDTDSNADVYVKELPAVPTSIDIAGCGNGQTGTASVIDIRSYGPRPLGCPVSLGGAAGNDYPDTTPILVGAALSMTIDWATGPNSYGIAAAKAGPTGTQWRFRLAITASPDHDTPATNQYLPAAGSGFTKTRLQGKFDVSALDSFNCTSGTADPLSWLSLANNASWVAKTS